MHSSRDDSSGSDCDGVDDSSNFGYDNNGHEIMAVMMMMISIIMVCLTYDNAGAICEKGSVTKMTSNERE